MEGVREDGEPTTHTILKLEIVEHTQLFGPPRYDFLATYSDGEAVLVGALMQQMGAGMMEMSGQLVLIRPDRWPHATKEQGA
jgi:hypothetical protein